MTTPNTTPTTAIEHFDVIIVGAGLAGIGAACHLRQRCPDRTFAVLEARPTLGGTWDLFRYPGVRSDSDMHTLGYVWRPWQETDTIIAGGRILSYIKETAAEAGIEGNIRFNTRALSASWSSADGRWTVESKNGETTTQLTCQFLMMCSGYYDYSAGHAPAFANVDQFRGQLVYPQFWPQDLDYAGKELVVIGSGATAMTLVPALAKTAKHVVMLQRSPTYVLSRPTIDAWAKHLHGWLPSALVGGIVRLKNMAINQMFYEFSRWQPRLSRRILVGRVKKELGHHYDVATHFNPAYAPWDQRICVVPDSDLFTVIRDGRASIVTDHIASFTPTGLKLRSGKELTADIVVSATGLKLNLLGDVRLEVDGQPVNLAKAMLYKGTMLSDVPNLAMLFGYTNASWTLKTDLVSAYLCRLLNYMKKNHFARVIARRDPKVGETPFLDLSSGYFQRAQDLLPRQGTKAPWKLKQSYPYDFAYLKFGRLVDDVLTFS